VAVGASSSGTTTKTVTDVATVTAVATVTNATTVIEKSPQPRATPARTVTVSVKQPSPSALTTSAESGGSGQTVPGGLVGETLLQAEQTLSYDGINYTTAGGDVILRGDWGVCATSPAAGQPITGAVVLDIGHFSCGA
jgi:hypothetical protein